MSSSASYSTDSGVWKPSTVITAAAAEPANPEPSPAAEPAAAEPAEPAEPAAPDATSGVVGAGSFCSWSRFLLQPASASAPRAATIVSFRMGRS